eukprot:6931716-Prorocentrum_lima.AAC.1
MAKLNERQAQVQEETDDAKVLVEYLRHLRSEPGSENQDDAGDMDLDAAQDDDDAPLCPPVKRQATSSPSPTSAPQAPA